MNDERTCTRFEYDGALCGRPTSYIDGWCRECDGYASPEPARGTPAKSVYRFRDERSVSEVPNRLAALRVSRAAARHFKKHHVHSRWDEVEPQLRMLVKDLLQDEASNASCSDRGTWGLASADPGGYSVLLSPEGEVVIGYITVHAERTYAQAKEGVRSRVSLRDEKSRAKRAGYVLAQEVVLNGLDEEVARLRAHGHGHPKTAEYFERDLARLREA